MVACASFDSRGGASRTTPAHLPMISVSSCKTASNCRSWHSSSTPCLLQCHRHQLAKLCKTAM